MKEVRVMNNNFAEKWKRLNFSVIFKKTKPTQSLKFDTQEGEPLSYSLIFEILFSFCYKDFVLSLIRLHYIFASCYLLLLIIYYSYHILFKFSGGDFRMITIR